MLDVNKHVLINSTEEDCDLLFEWANDIDVRLNSFNSHAIKYEDHINWFNDKMKSKDSDIYIFEVNKEKVGSIRIEKIKDNTYIINYSIAKEYRRKGYGSILLMLIKEKYNTKLLIGKVKKDNVGSIKSFKKAGYFMEEETDHLVFYSNNK